MCTVQSLESISDNLPLSRTIMQTHTIDQVYGLPYGTVHRLPLWTPPTDHPPQKKIKITNQDFTFELSNRLLTLVKFRMLCCTNSNTLG